MVPGSGLNELWSVTFMCHHWIKWAFLHNCCISMTLKNKVITRWTVSDWERALCASNLGKSRQKLKRHGLNFRVWSKSRTLCNFLRLTLKDTHCKCNKDVSGLLFWMTGCWKFSNDMRAPSLLYCWSLFLRRPSNAILCFHKWIG